jgi:hypothetical protein
MCRRLIALMLYALLTCSEAAILFLILVNKGAILCTITADKQRLDNEQQQQQQQRKDPIHHDGGSIECMSVMLVENRPLMALVKGSFVYFLATGAECRDSFHIVRRVFRIAPLAPSTQSKYQKVHHLDVLVVMISRMSLQQHD